MSYYKFYSFFTATAISSALIFSAMQPTFAAEDYLNDKAQITRPEHAENITNIYDYDRSDYVAEKWRIGSFEVAPAIGADVIFDDNIFATDTNEESDTVVLVVPNISFTSDWGVHEIAGGAHVAIGRYDKNDDENFEDYSAYISGRLDVKRNSYAMGNFSYNRRHEERGSPDADATSIEPTLYYETNAEIGYVHAQGRFSTTAFIGLTNLGFDDGVTSANAVIDNDDRNRVETSYSVQPSYEIAPGYRAFIRATFNEVKYDDTTSQGRDNNGMSIVIGSDLDLGSKVRGEIYAGVMERDYDDSVTFKNIDKVMYGADLLWNINGLSSLQGTITRSIEETTIGAASGYISTSSNIVFQHELRRNIIFEGNLGYAEHDYVGYTATQNDKYTMAGFEVRYILNKYLTSGLSYDYTDRNSNIAGNDHSKNLIKIRLAAFF